ncbi:ParB/RepB/Spo0J family partition protein [Oceanibium sediminis]|uniref:ParB/RepB/Spo0J family partition protein n=1 Tax=Oceanibium sediminis TaxID=2026339 RepID=UPI000DD2C795|nr:ParB/RepB/Spo0J family partition protein [Oceanibium sediminis]
MAKKTDRRGLGRGLSALLADTDLSDAPSGRGGVNAGDTLPIEMVIPNPNQPRRDFLEQDLDELAKSIERNGIIQPIVVRPAPDMPQTYQIVAGERRWRAAQRAKLHEVPVVIRSFSDEELLEVAIIENIQRVDLNPVEEAMGYRQLMDGFGHTQDALAEALGKSRSHIANTLRLLALPEQVLAHLRAGRLSAGHARALITAPDPVALAAQVIAQGLSVRQTEALVKKAPTPPKPRKSAKLEKDADTRAIEGDLTAQLGMPVSINHAPGAEGGQMQIKYRSLDDLDKLLEMLSGN